MAVLHQHCSAPRSMLANRLRPIDQPVVANNCCPQRALDAIQPLFLFVLWQEMPTAQCGNTRLSKGQRRVARKANCRCWGMLSLGVQLLDAVARLRRQFCKSLLQARVFELLDRRNGGGRCCRPDHSGATWQTTANARRDFAVRLVPARCTVRQLWMDTSPRLKGQLIAWSTPMGSVTRWCPWRACSRTGPRCEPGRYSKQPLSKVAGSSVSQTVPPWWGGGRPIRKIGFGWSTTHPRRFGLCCMPTTRTSWSRCWPRPWRK